GEFLDDVGLRESLIDIAILARCADDVSSSPAEIRRIRSHDLLESCCERKDVVFDLDCIRGIVGKVLGICRNNRDDLPLEKEFVGQRIALWRISGRKYISHARHFLGLRHVESLHSRAWMGTGEQPAPKHVGQQNPSGVLRLSRIPRNRDFGHWRMRLPKQIQIFRRVALPLLCYDLRVAFDEHVLWTVTATGGEIPNHRLVHDDHMFGFRLDLLFGFLVLAHTDLPIPFYSNTSGTENVMTVLPAALAMMTSL